jgi:hypothetical protein
MTAPRRAALALQARTDNSGAPTGQTCVYLPAGLLDA